jgi:23S rRNA (adenine2503-C2)-methyltransferase
MEKTVNLLDLSPEGIASFLVSIGEKPVFTGKIIRHLFECRNTIIDEPSYLPESLKHKLRQISGHAALEVLEESKSADGKNIKTLFGLEDGNTIESTAMEFGGSAGKIRRTVCVSSQVGCMIGCPYCATGMNGFHRNLSPGEMIEQVLYYRGETGRVGRNSLTNVVFMGMGEPLLNYDNVVTAVSLLNSHHGMGFGARQITISTSGIVPGILRLAREDLYCQLAVSIQSATDELRNLLVPVNRKYPLAHLIEACREYSELTRRKVFIEYVLFEGVNDSIQDAEGLAKLLEPLDCSINLIIVNNSGIGTFRPTSYDTVVAFQRLLVSKGFRTMLRLSRGTDIEAGCGQLRNRRLRITN